MDSSVFIWHSKQDSFNFDPLILLKALVNYAYLAARQVPNVQFGFNKSN